MIDIFEKEVLSAVFKAFNGNERRWSIRRENHWSKWFIPKSVEELLTQIDDNCELNFSTGRYRNDHLRYWTMVIDIDLVDGKEDDRLKELEMQKVVKLLEKFKICFLVDTRFHIWIPDWETCLVEDWTSKYNNPNFSSSLKYYLERTCKLKVGSVDTRPWTNHLIRAPYSKHLRTNSVQRFDERYLQKFVEVQDGFSTAIGVWTGELLDKRTYKFAERFRKFIETAEEEGLYIRRLMCSEPSFEIENPTGDIRPCLLSLPKKPSHVNRLAFVLEWMNKTELSVDDLVEKFRGVVDFKESVTRYQIEHSMRKRYKPFSCKKLFLHGICIGEKCEKFKRLIER